MPLRQAAVATAREFMRAIRACQRIGVFLAVLGAVSPALPGWAAETKPGAAPKPSGSALAAARRLEERLAGVKAVEADFSQTIDTPALPEPQVESGRMFLERPGRMRWEYTRPQGKLAVADGRDSWLWLPEDRVAITAPIGGTERDSGVSLLMQDRPDLIGRFTVDWAPGLKGAPRPLRLRPREAGGPYDALLVIVDDTGFPRELIVIDPLGGRLTYRFANLRFSNRLDPALFVFSPPPGATVQRATP